MLSHNMRGVDATKHKLATVGSVGVPAKEKKQGLSDCQLLRARGKEKGNWISMSRKGGKIGV